AVEEEGRVARLGGDARDAADVYVRATTAVEELEVEVERLVVAGEPARQARRHLVGARRFEGFVGGGLAHFLPRQRWHEHLWLEPSRLHERGFADLCRQHAVFDEEDITVESGALVPGPHLGDHAEDVDRLVVAGETTLEGNDV